MSAPSGIPTFRGSGGLYEGRDVSRLATPEGFASDPVLVWNWYAERIRVLRTKKPNAGHHALVELEGIAERVSIITSNVDDLHFMAGSSRVERLHGSILQVKGVESGAVYAVDEGGWPMLFSEVDELPCCPEGELLRPNVVWFGEYPWEGAFDLLRAELPEASVFLEVGVSGSVGYGFTELAARMGIPIVRVNPEGVGGMGVKVIRESADVALVGMLDRLRHT